MSEDWFQLEQLHQAAQRGDAKLAANLIERGCDPNSFDELGNTPLHYAAEEEHFDIVKLLLSHGANVNACCEARSGDTPIGHVAGTCSLAMANLLVEAGADPTIPGSMQIDALYHAKQRKRGDGPKVYDLLRRRAGSTDE